MLGPLQDWLRDPPPSLVFEIAETGVSLARVGPKSRLPEALAFAPLAAGVLEASPIKENLHRPDELDQALQQLLQKEVPARKKREAALLLPDSCARLAVLDFETLPGDVNERTSLIRWRLKKTVPFDADTAALSYQVQRALPGEKSLSVLVAVSPIEVIGQYEAALRRQGLAPGYVSVAVAAALNLMEDAGVTMLAKLSGRALTLVVLQEGRVRLIRSLEAGPAPPGELISEDRLREMAADLYPTFVYVADNLGAPVSRLILAGFGASFGPAREVFRRELGSEAEPLKGPQGVIEPHTAGIWGFLNAN
jgi:type IV pilus assembly protein PilM